MPSISHSYGLDRFCWRYQKQLTARDAHHQSLLALLRKLAMVLFISGLWHLPAATGQYAITTVAGNGGGGWSGDGPDAKAVQLNAPRRIALDGSGNLFISDYMNHRIRKVDPSGAISTVAGTGVGGWNGDGADATLAQLHYPMGVTVDSSGNLFIADYFNARIRKVDTSGAISTIAGTGTHAWNGDGADATIAQLNTPSGVAVDSSGNLFIAENMGFRIRKVDTSGAISTVAGTGTSGWNGDGPDATAARLFHPEDVAVDSSGNLFIAEYSNHRIRKVDTSGAISTVAGNGTNGWNGDGPDAKAAHLSGPKGIAVDSRGNLFIADHSNARIRKVDSSGVISTVAGTGITGWNGDGPDATAAQLAGPYGVAVDRSGNVFIADYINNRIRKLFFSGMHAVPSVGGLGMLILSLLTAWVVVLRWHKKNIVAA